jgi:hypothetical protein
LGFRGAADSLEQGSWFGHRLTGRRRYKVRTSTLPIPPARTVLIQMPSVVVNGQMRNFPPVRFDNVTEAVCRPIPLQ